MKVLNFLRPENGLTEDPLYYLGFEKYENEVEDSYFFMADFYDALMSGNYDDKKKIVLTLEEPNFCTVGSPHEVIHEKADRILTLCPYTARVLDKREFVFFPTNEDMIPNTDVEKTIDFCYFGSMPGSVPWSSYINSLSLKYNFFHTSYSNGPSCSYKEKLEIYSKSKISIVHGLCNVKSLDINRYKNFLKASENRAFDYLDRGTLPQIKSRMFEAAFSKSLILCQADPWNPIEYFFEPDVDFLYFKDEEDLIKKSDQILKNYSEYDNMRESAYQKAINNYTTQKFVEKFLK